MINLLVVYDDNDSNLGDYFEESFNSLIREIVKNANISTTSIRGLDCSEVNVNSRIAAYNADHFIFVSFSHGNEEQLLTENEVFVSDGNSHVFHKSLFYTSACECSSILAGQLVSKGCLAFVGYTGTVDVWEGYYDVFIDCENHAIIEFLTSNKTIGETFSEMRNKYNDAIDELALGGLEDTIVASLLVANRDKLALIGNADITITDFTING